MSSEQPKIGTILDGPSAGRDAVHVAIAPVVAGQTLMPGWHVGFEDGEAITCHSSEKPMKMIGIVDPFIQGSVKKGEWFYLFLYPGTITTLRHVWQHPEFSIKIPERRDESD